MKIVKFQSSYTEPYPLQVVGEASYRDEIEEVTGYTGEDEGINADDFIAHLILDDNNIYDRGNAVAVEIDGKTVGYLSKSDAKKYRAKLKELGLDDVVGECYASIKGGFIRRSGEQADFGVRLDIIIEEIKLQPTPQIKPPQSIASNLLLSKQQPAPATSKSAPKKSRMSIIAIILIISIVLVCVAVVVDQVSLVLENAGLISTRTPIPTSTPSSFDIFNMTQTALSSP